MEWIVTSLNLLLFVGLLVGPILLLRGIGRTHLSHKRIWFYGLGLVLMAFICTLFAWWRYTSDLLLLQHFGYNMDGINERARFKNVLPEHVTTVKSLEISIMGIGWPVKAMVVFVMCLPYLWVVNSINSLIKRINYN